MLLSLQRCRTNTTKLRQRWTGTNGKSDFTRVAPLRVKGWNNPHSFLKVWPSCELLETCEPRSWHPYTDAALQGFLYCSVALHCGMLLRISVNEQLVQQRALCLLYLDQKRTGNRTYLRTSLVSCCQDNGITTDYSNQTRKTRVYQSQTYITCKPYKLRSKLYHFLVRSQNFEKRLLVSSCATVRPSLRPPEYKNSASTGRIFIQFDIWVFFWKYVEKFEVSLKSDKNNGYVTWIHISDHISLSSS